MEIFTCLAGFTDGFIQTFQCVRHDGKLWLVVSWLEHPTEPTAYPERMIRFDNLGYSHSETGPYQYQNILLPICESDLLGELPEGIEYEDHPQNISVEIQQLIGN